MNIRNVRDKFKHFGTLSIGQLAEVTGESREDLTFVVTELLQRGKIEAIDMTQFCGGGCSCSTVKQSECGVTDYYYRWITKTP